MILTVGQQQLSLRVHCAASTLEPMVHVLDGPPSSWAIVYPSAQLGNRFHAIAGAFTWAWSRGLKLAVVWPPDGALLGTHQGCESAGSEIVHAAQHVRVDWHDVFEAHPDLTVPRSVPSDLAERLGLKRSESCAAGDTAPPCVFHVGLWHGAARHHKGVRRVPPLPARASADAQKQACRAMLGRLRSRCTQQCRATTLSPFAAPSSSCRRSTRRA